METTTTGKVLIRIKPLSANEAWKGRRYKTDKYRAYQKELLFRLPKLKLPEPPYCLKLTFGFSNSAADWDNPVKMFQDVLQKKYGFNDRDVVKAVVEKRVVKKGDEFIYFAIEKLSQPDWFKVAAQRRIPIPQDDDYAELDKVKNELIAELFNEIIKSGKVIHEFSIPGTDLIEDKLTITTSLFVK